MIGRTLGHYRIEERLGAGGMGTVYRARDLRLERTVAIKTLDAPDDGNVERVLREARAASALNHPHVCIVYEVGEAEGAAFIVMEYVEGRSLSTIVPTDGLPLETVVRYGAQIAAALEHAHEHGVIHRDLKSSNIMIDPEGRAKVLDFGLAARVRDVGEDEETRTRRSLADSSPVEGTLAYLAPEILLEQPASPQSDLWALGVVLHEMAGGELPFHGRNAFETTAAVLRSPARPLPPQVPASMRLVIQRCLAKDPRQRYRRAGEVRAALEALESSEAIRPLPSARPLLALRSRRRSIAAAAGISAAAGIGLLLRFGSVSEPPVGGGRLSLLLSTERLAYDPTLSPEGKTVAYVMEDEAGQFDLYVARTAGGGRVRLTDDEAREASPRFSPDGERVAFSRLPRAGPSEICVVPALGGAVVPLIERAAEPVWSPDQSRLAFLHRPSRDEPVVLATAKADGSDVRLLLRADSAYPFLRHPAWSPDGETIAIVRGTGGIDGEIWLVPARGGDPRRFFDDPGGVYSHYPVFTPDGRGLVYASNRAGSTNLWFVGLDGRTPVRLTSGAGPDESPSVAADGSVAFLNSRWRYLLVIRDLASGSERTLATHSSFIWGPAFSPDGRELAFSRSEADGSWQIWTVAMDGGPARQITATAQGAVYPRFWPDGGTLVYHSWVAPHRIWRAPARGGPAEPVSSADEPHETFADVAPDGQRIAFVKLDGDVERVYVALADGSALKLLTRSPATLPRWSPDGEWIAFSADRGYMGGLFVVREDGRDERRLTERGGWPVWWPDGSRIAGLTVGPDGNQEIIVVPFEGGEPTPIEGLRFAGLNYPFDVSPDGRWVATSNGLHFADEIWKLEPAR